MLGTGATWPADGEIDIIEGISNNPRNLMSLHTSDGCTFTKQTELGSFVGGNCYGGATNGAGCGVTTSTAASYGASLNSAGGGDYVVEWTSSYIKIWSWPSTALPADIKAGKPVPGSAGWGTPQGYWLGSSTCNIDSKFKTQRIIVNTNFCGDWAGNADVWASDATCKAKASTCASYVAKNPTAFVNANWKINSIKVYQLGTATKRGLEDPTLEWEEGLRNGTIAGAQGEIEDTLEIRTSKQNAGAHLHRHRHIKNRL
jgi:hypothetical protein